MPTQGGQARRSSWVAPVASSGGTHSRKPAKQPEPGSPVGGFALGSGCHCLSLKWRVRTPPPQPWLPGKQGSSCRALQDQAPRPHSTHPGQPRPQGGCTDAPLLVRGTHKGENLCPQRPGPRLAPGPLNSGRVPPLPEQGLTAPVCANHVASHMVFTNCGHLLSFQGPELACAGHRVPIEQPNENPWAMSCQQAPPVTLQQLLEAVTVPPAGQAPAGRAPQTCPRLPLYFLSFPCRKSCCSTTLG